MANLLIAHKKRIFIGLGFLSTYGIYCKATIKHPSEAIRLGAVGSIVNVICETGFHIVDTVNIKSKVNGTSTL